MVDESDEDIDDVEDEPQPQVVVEEEEEDEIIESDIELEGETVEPDNDPPQKVFFTHIDFLLDIYLWILIFSVERYMSQILIL